MDTESFNTRSQLLPMAVGPSSRQVVGDMEYSLWDEAPAKQAGLVDHFEGNRRKQKGGDLAFRIVTSMTATADSRRSIYLVRRNVVGAMQAVAQFSVLSFGEMTVVSPTPVSKNVKMPIVLAYKAQFLAAVYEQHKDGTLWGVTTPEGVKWEELDALRRQGFDDKIRLPPKYIARLRLIDGGNVDAIWAVAKSDTEVFLNSLPNSWWGRVGNVLLRTADWIAKRAKVTGKMKSAAGEIEVSIEGRAMSDLH